MGIGGINFTSECFWVDTGTPKWYRVDRFTGMHAQSKSTAPHVRTRGRHVNDPLPIAFLAIQLLGI